MLQCSNKSLTQIPVYDIMKLESRVHEQRSFVMIGSLYPTFAGGRYAVVPGVILIFLIFRIFSCEKKLIIKYSCAILLSFSLIVGLIEFRHYSPLPDLLKCDYYKIG